MWNSTLTRQQVILAERPAWARGYRYYYDGINFWKRTIRGRQVAAPQTPAEGWRHKEDCQCEFCRDPERVETPESAQNPSSDAPKAGMGRGNAPDLSSGGRKL